MVLADAQGGRVGLRYRDYGPWDGTSNDGELVPAGKIARMRTYA